MSLTDDLSAWIAFRRAPDAPRARLFCFAHAGGSALEYRGWAETLPADIDLCPIQLPGRGARFAEPPVRRLTALAAALVEAIAPLIDSPYLLFGHSMGAALAYETALRLMAKGLPGPAVLGVSAHIPAHWPTREPIHQLPDDAFVERLRGFEGTPPEIFDSLEMMELVLPIARADFEANDTYRAAGRPLDCPVVAFGGLADETVDRAALEGWRELTTAEFRLEMLPGGHFFLRQQQRRVQAALLDALALSGAWS